MSTSSVDISAGLITGIYNVLNNNVTVGSITYPVYTTKLKGQSNRAYVYIGNVIDNDNGTKEEFIYEGSIAVESVDESQVNNPTRSTVQAINNKVRSLLKTTRTETPTVSGRTVVVFRHGGSSMMTEKAADGRIRYRIIDIYEFIIQ